VGETAWDGSFSDDQIQALIRQGAVRADSQHRRQRLLCPPEAPVSSARQALLKPEPVAPDPTAAAAAAASAAAAAAAAASAESCAGFPRIMGFA
jgi:hypothetical protein